MGSASSVGFDIIKTFYLCLHISLRVGRSWFTFACMNTPLFFNDDKPPILALTKILQCMLDERPFLQSHLLHF
ncbi:hypothetical protein JHK86_040171 [Glycine max]|nr:hypothetical protein JHK86_040171 [Glycine max]